MKVKRQEKGYPTVLVLLLLTIIFFAGANSPKAIAQTKGGVEGFYKGATLNFVVPHSPGGPFDLWARGLAPHLEKHTGARVVVNNMPGAGGLVGGSHLYAIAKPDGLTIGVLPLSGMVVAEMLEFDTVRYEMEKYSYIGRVEIIQRALFASKASGMRSIADMQKYPKVIRFGTVDPTSSSTVDASLFAEAFNLKAKIIPGFKGSKEYMLALISGREADAASTGLSAYGDYVKRGEISMIAVAGQKRNPDFPAVPTLMETPGLKPESKKLIELIAVITDGGRAIAAPPGIPEDRRLFLEKALLASTKEPALIDWAKKNDFEIAFLSGKECKDLMSKLLEVVPKSERPKFKYIITEKYF